MIAVYIRVSTHSQNLAGQRSEIRKWLAGQGIAESNVLWFTDQRGGDDLKREGFERLQASIFAGKVDTVVCWKLDRVSRKLGDGIRTLCEWCERGVRVVSVTQQLDFSGTVGRLVASVLFAVAEMEQETRRERQAAGIAVAREAGKYVGGNNRGHRKASPARVRELREKGLSQAEMARTLGVSRMTVSRYLKETA